MRVNTYVLDKTIEASTNLSAYQWCFVKPTTGVGQSAQLALHTGAAATNNVAFILQNKPAAQGHGGVIRVYGMSELCVDGTTPIVPGDPLKPKAGGLGTKCSAGDGYSAIALEPSTAATDRIEVLCERGIL